MSMDSNPSTRALLSSIANSHMTVLDRTTGKVILLLVMKQHLHLRYQHPIHIVLLMNLPSLLHHQVILRIEIDLMLIVVVVVVEDVVIFVDLLLPIIINLHLINLHLIMVLVHHQLHPPINLPFNLIHIQHWVLMYLMILILLHLPLVHLPVLMIQMMMNCEI